MNLVLERLDEDSALGDAAHADLFNATGILLLGKGQPITDNLRMRIKNQEVYILENHQDGLPKKIPTDAYIKLIGSTWTIFHRAKIIKREQLKKALRLVETILAEIRNRRVYIDFEAVHLESFSMKNYDYGTYVHSVNVALLVAIIGRQLGYRETKLKYLVLGALLHDLGKLKVPTDILNKPGNLTDDEFRTIKQHPLFGEEMLSDVGLLTGLRAMIKEHHERWDGKGYPCGLAGNDIHMDAQIVAVADVYEALTADRPYRKGLPPYHALEMILAGSGKDFNPEVVEAFRSSLVLYPENASVTLNTGEVGVVVAVPMQMPTRPLVRLLFDSNGRFLNQERYVDLLENLTCFVEHVEFNEAGPIWDVS